jgi:hypothetical protein
MFSKIKHAQHHQKKISIQKTLNKKNNITGEGF